VRVAEVEAPDKRAGRLRRELVERHDEPGHQVLRVRRLVRSERVPLVLQPPGDERLEHRREVAALFRQLIPDLAAARLLAPRDDPLALEPSQPDRQPLRRHRREQTAQIAEAAGTAEEVADDQERPAVADGVERARREAEMAVAGGHRLTSG
jgi:hypothetical protein